MASISDAAGETAEGMGSVASQSAKAADDLDDAGDAASGATSSLESFGNVGPAAVAAVTAAVGAAGVASTKMAADFEESFSKIEGLVGLSAEQTDRLREDVLALSDDVAKGPQELSEALFQITSAGLEGEQAMNALETSAKAAQAGLGDTQTVADAATSAMNAYGKETLSAAEATDVLVASVREGKVQPEQLAGSLGKVIPTASKLGVEFDQVGAALAAMTRQGANAERATTALNSLLTQIQDPADDARDTLQDAGLSLEELRRQVEDKGLLAVMDLLQNEFQGNTDALSSLFGNVRAMRAAMQLTGESADQTRQIFSELESSTGATDAAFEKAKETFNFKFDQLRTSAKKAGIQLGQSLLPAAKDVVEVIGDLASAFNELDSATQKSVLFAGGAALATGPIIKGVKGITAAVKSLSGVLGTGALAGGGGLSALITGAVAVPAGGGILRWMRGVEGKAADLQGQTESLSQAYKDLAGSVNLADPAEGALSEIQGLSQRIQSALSSTATELEKVRQKRQKLEKAQANGAQVSSDYFSQIVKQESALESQLQTQSTLLGNLQDWLGIARENLNVQKKTTDEINNQAAASEQLQLPDVTSVSVPEAPAPEEAGPIEQEAPSFDQGILDLPDANVGEIESAVQSGLIQSVDQADAALARLKGRFQGAMGQQQRTRIQGVIKRVQALKKQMRGTSQKTGQMAKAGTVAMTSLKKSSAAALQSIQAGLSRALMSMQGVIQGTRSLGSVFKQVGKTIVRALVQMIAKLAAAMAMVTALNAIPGGSAVLEFADTASGAGGLLGLAEGGVVTSPTLAMIGEGSESEAVMPLSKLDQMMGESGGSTPQSSGGQGGTLRAQIDMDKLIFALEQRESFQGS